MYFKDSCVTILSNFSCIEESTAVPTQIFPVYIGTGNSVLSIDGTGLQGYNHGVQKAFGSMPEAGDMYVMSHGMMSDVINEDNVHPYGYFTWRMKTEDLIISEENLTQYAAVWKRKNHIDRGNVITSMVINEKIVLEIDVTAPLETDCFVIRLRTKAYDRSNQKTNRVQKVQCDISLNMMTRKGKAVYQTARFEDNAVFAGYDGLEHYDFRIGTELSDGAVTFENSRLMVSVPLEITDEWSTSNVVFNFSKEKLGQTVEELLAANIRRRRERLAGFAQLSGLDPVVTYLYNNTLNLIISCFDSNKGYPIGSPFYFPWCWRCSTFWDSTFIMDGLMRLGDKKDADNFLKYLRKCLNETGKPYSWMFAYTGKSTVENDRDIAPLVMCAHAMTAIRHFEYFGDLDMLKEHGYEIIRRVSYYAAENLFGRNNDGRWILSLPVSNDVVEEEALEINQTFTLIWFLSIIKKCAEYEKDIFNGKSGILDDILANYHIEHDDEEYLHSLETKASEHNCASWIPFLLYPTEGTPFVDMKLLNKTREKYSWEELYMDIQGCFQPWTDMIQATSDLRRSDAEEGYRMFLRGISHTYGVGYFSEIGPMQQTVGLPPYISAFGSFLDYITSLYVGTDIWSSRLQIFTAIPKELQKASFSVSNIKCNKGLDVSAQIDNGRFLTQITCKGSRNIRLECRVPWDLEIEDIQVLANDHRVSYEIVNRRKKIIGVALEITNFVRVEII